MVGLDTENEIWYLWIELQWVGLGMRENEGRWRELCAQAAIEQDPRKLHELTEEIIRLLKIKEDRLAAQRQNAGKGSKQKDT